MIRQLWSVDESQVTSAISTSGTERRRIRRKVTRLVVVVCAVFAVCWAPSHVMWLWSNSWALPRRYSFYYARIASHALSYANSAMNPVIYAFLSANFRKGFQRALYCRSRGQDAGVRGGQWGQGSATPRSPVTANHHVTLTSQTTAATQSQGHSQSSARRSLVCIGKSFSQDTAVNSSFL